MLLWDPRETLRACTCRYHLHHVINLSLKILQRENEGFQNFLSHLHNTPLSAPCLFTNYCQYFVCCSFVSWGEKNIMFLSFLIHCMYLKIGQLNYLSCSPWCLNMWILNCHNVFFLNFHYLLSLISSGSAGSSTLTASTHHQTDWSFDKTTQVNLY